MLSVEDLFAIEGALVHVVERSRSGQLSQPMARLASMAPWLNFMAARCKDCPCPRTSVQGDSSHGEITFIGPIEGRLLEPFVILLRDLARGHADLDTPATASLLKNLRTNRGLSVAVSGSCPRCPRTLGTALSVALCSAYIDVVVARADLGLGPKATSVPTIYIDGRAVPRSRHSEYALAESLLTPPER